MTVWAVSSSETMAAKTRSSPAVLPMSLLPN
jgi:hypothetical protein